MNWFELVTGVAKKGMEIFNQVKGLLPEGAMKNMKIPGLPADIGAKIGDFSDMVSKV